MERLTISPLNIEEDIPVIKSWEDRFNNHPKFTNIKHFILEDNTYYGLDEVILTNFEFFHIGDDEKKYCLAIRNDSEPVGFILACMFNISENKPELIIQYIVLNPDYQNLGYGTDILKELLTNSKKYFSHNPCEVYANIQKENQASLNLFKKFGFSYSKAPFDYVRVHKTIKTLEEEKI